jgi:hypothetical protein
MTENDLIKAKIELFVNDQKMFTSINVANAIKKDGTWIRNSVVAEWLRENFELVNENLGDSYLISQIPVRNGTLTANLYYPFFADTNNFNDRDAEAMTPDEFSKLHKYTSTDSRALPPLVSTTVKTDTTNVLSKNVPSIPVNLPTRTITEKANGRLKIPAAFVKALGLKPGDYVAASDKIKFPNFPSNIIVQSDFRISIPRKLLSLGQGPVRIYIKDGQLGIEKI